MKTIAFLGLLGGSYAVFSTFLSQTPSSLLAWPVAIVGVFCLSRIQARHEFRKAIASGDDIEIARASLRFDPEFAFSSDAELDRLISLVADQQSVQEPPGEPHCLSCGTVLSPDARFCSACGQRVAD